MPKLGGGESLPPGQGGFLGAGGGLRAGGSPKQFFNNYYSDPLYKLEMNIDLGRCYAFQNFLQLLEGLFRAVTCSCYGYPGTPPKVHSNLSDRHTAGNGYM